MKQLTVFAFLVFSSFFVFAQHSSADNLKMKKDSTLRAMIHEDSMKVEKQFAEAEEMEKIAAKMQYPYIKNGGKFSGIIPVTDPTEIPDPNHDYKLLFEVVFTNPDSLATEINHSLTEVARIMNLHFASGIPAKRIIPIILVHGPALDAIMNNENYKKKHSVDNPNLQLIKEFEKDGANFIACGQAMAFFNVTKDQLLPEIKVSLTAQTVLSNYQSQGYVLYKINPDK